MKEKVVPKFVSIIAIALGCLDLIRGFMHTIRLEYAATNIAGLDLSTALASDLLRLMGSFGISNFLTGSMLILIGWKARPIALAMMGIIPAAYLVGMVGIRVNTASYVTSQANWGGIPMMVGYLAICVITFITGLIITLSRKGKEKNA